jgi:hypothetical protein
MMGGLGVIECILGGVGVLEGRLGEIDCMLEEVEVMK